MQDEYDTPESIAVIGMSARFAGAETAADFWKVLCAGREMTTFFSRAELIEAGRNPLEVNQPNYVRANFILKDADLFAASFFDIPPSEAELLDPQQRFFLECCWEALEDAAYDPHLYKGWIGVFAGGAASEYWDHNLQPYCDHRPSVSFAAKMATRREYLATRVSYKLNLKGPSVNVITACSTSLVAVHQACQSLLSYQCDMSLAGGVSIDIPQKTGYLCMEGDIKSPDGRCRPFDAQANGTVFGSGAGVVVLKRLSDALADGDHIYAVIKGSAVNNDGAVKVGFPAPGLEGQKQVIALAQAAAGIDPATIGYIEAHGTGTALGDPIEIEALTQAFRAHTDGKQFCAIGSAKGCIGHTDAASGVANLIKASLALKHKMLPPSANYETANPKIDFANSPFYVNTELRAWDTDGQARRAGVSAFGIGGTNAHAVLEEAPEVRPSGESRRHQLLVLSARTRTALEKMTDRLAVHLETQPDLKLADLAYTLHVGRHTFETRRMVVCETLRDAVTAFQTRDAKRVLTGPPTKPDPSVVFLFSGQGAQYVNMGKDLYERESVFREQIDACAEGLKNHLGLDLRDLLYPAETDKDRAGARLEQTEFTQPALFAVEYALARLCAAWGLHPRAMIGHSIGEYTAACLAGVFSLEHALALVAMRGRLMQSLPPGAMLSVALSEADLKSRIDDALAVATINSPTQCVVSGPMETIAALERRLQAEGIFNRRLHTSHAFHSAMMDPILRSFRNEVGKVPLHSPRIPYISNVTGTWITPEQAADPDYWARHLRQSVRFSEGIGVLARTPEQVFLEVGPGHTLSTLAQRHPACRQDQVVLSSMRHPQDDQKDDAFLLHTLGRLWMAGATIDWPAFYQNERRLRLFLPGYPFERLRYWIDPPKDVPARRGALMKTPNLADWFYIPSWKRTLPPSPEPSQTADRWLVFGNDSRLSSGLVRRLRAQGDDVVSVSAGAQFNAGNDQVTLRPDQRDDYKTLWASLVERGRTPSQIVHLWNFTSANEENSDLNLSLFSLLFIAQAIGAKNPEAQVSLTVVSSYMQQAAGDEILHPEKATLLGPCKVIPQETPNLRTRSIDLTPPLPDSIQETRLLEQLTAELKTHTPGTIIAYRGQDRLVQTYEPVQLTELQETESKGLREKGVYMITGGLGGIGLALAGYLAETVQARLVLISRSRFPETLGARQHWLATHDPLDRTSLNIQAVQALEAAGAEVLVLRADVTDQAQMGAAVRAACERFGALHGVIHSAGLPGGGVIQLKTEQAASAVLAPKIRGTRVLETVLRDVPIDFLMLCSSVAAVFGGAGQVDYCAANAFMDAFAQACAARNSFKVIAVNWDAWAEVGMAFNTPPTFTAPPQPSARRATAVRHPLLRDFHEETPGRVVFRLEFDPAKDWLLSDHVLWGIPTVPGSTHMELARAAFANHTGSARVEIREAIFLAPLMVSPGDGKSAQLILEEQEGGFDFQVRSKAGVTRGGETLWQKHVMGKIGPLTDRQPQPFDLEALRARCRLSEKNITHDMAASQDSPVQFGPRWRALRAVYTGDHETLCFIALDAELQADVESFKLHPALLDIATSFVTTNTDRTDLDLPFSYKRMKVFGDLPGGFYSYARRIPGRSDGGETISAQLFMLDEQGRVLAEVEEFTMMRVDEKAGSRLRGAAAKPGAGANLPGQAPARFQRPDLINAISPAEGVQAFQRILSRARLPQIAVCTRHLPTLIEQGGTPAQTSSPDETDSIPSTKIKHARPNLPTSYAAPRNDIENRLAAVWQEVLGIGEVGIHDTFFELGGDSMLGIQVMVKLRAAGFPVDPEQFFKYRTIAELSETLTPASATPTERPLMPFQQRLMMQADREPYILELAVGQPLDLDVLNRAVEMVHKQHDALQLRFRHKEGIWRQVVEISSGPKPVRSADLSLFTGTERDQALAAEISRLKQEAGSSEPPVLRTTCVRFGDGAPDRLLLAIERLGADEASHPLLLQDLQAAYQRAAGETDRALPQPTATFGDWVSWLAQYDPSAEFNEERTWWQTMSRHEPCGLPTDFDSNRSSDTEIQHMALSLTKEQTEQWQSFLKRNPIQPEELILCALAQMLIEWSGQKQLWIGLNHFQRDAVFDDLDTSRLVGCLRTSYPFWIDLSGKKPAELPGIVKEQVRQASTHSLSYSLLCAVDPTLRRQPPIAFTYRPPLSGYKLFQVAGVHTPLGPLDGLLHLYAGQVDQQLRMDWHYRSDRYRWTTIEQRGRRMIFLLLALIGNAGGTGAVQFTPADFPAAGLNQEKLDQIMNQLSKKK